MRSNLCKAAVHWERPHWERFHWESAAQRVPIADALSQRATPYQSHVKFGDDSALNALTPHLVDGVLYCA